LIAPVMDERSPETSFDAVPPAGVEARARLRATGVSAYDYLLFYIGCTSLAIMALVATSAFSPALALALGFLLTLVVAVLLRDRRAGEDKHFARADTWVLAILVLALFLRANISTNYLGGLDPGLYVAFSGITEHSGGPYFTDLFRAGLPEHLGELYDRATMQGAIPLGNGPRYELTFYPLHPAWMAVFSGLFGADAHGYSVLIFSLLGVAGAYFFARELGEGDGLAEARLAAVLTAVNPALCYLAKMPLSEAQSTALLMNAAYLLTKGLKSEGRGQILLLATSLLLVIGFFFTRLSFPILLVPAIALYVLTYSGRIDAIAAKRLRAYLWLVVAGLVLALFVYRALLPTLFDAVFDVYLGLIAGHPYLLSVALLLMLGLLAATATPLRSRFAPAAEFAARASERAAPWLPPVLLLAGIPRMIATARDGMLFYPGELISTLQVTPEPTAFRYHLLYRLVLALTPFLLAVLVTLPWLGGNRRRLAIPLLFLGGVWAFTQAFSSTLPNLYYHIRFIASEVVPLSLVILSIVLVATARSGRLHRLLAAAVAISALAMMTAFSLLQLRGKEGEDAGFFHEIDAQVSDKDAIVASEREVGNRVSVPVRYYFNKQLFVLPRDATLADAENVVGYLLANSGSRYGRVLILSSQAAAAQPFNVTLAASLQLTESGISNTENFRFDGFQSTSLRHLLLPTIWRTRVETYYLYRVNAVPDRQISRDCSIDFSLQGDASKYILSGWGDAERSYRWTVGHEAVLRIPAAPAERGVRRLRLLAMAFTPGGQRQRVEVLLDAKKVADLTVDTSWRDYDIDVGASLGAGEHMIVFRLPDARSPKSAGVGDDARVLGIAVASLRLLSPDGRSELCD
jgi:hypothetical protein